MLGDPTYSDVAFVVKCVDDKAGGLLTGMPVRDSDGFGGGSDSGGFGWIPSSPAGDLFAELQSVWAFRPYRSGFRIRTDSVESRIRTDSRTPNMEVGNPGY